MKIYLLAGCTGEQADYEEWIVAAYTTMEQAAAHKFKAEQAALSAMGQGLTRWQLEDKVRAEGWDPFMHMDFNGTCYLIQEVEVFRHIDEYLESKGR
jgi:hypothetical protein